MPPAALVVSAEMLEPPVATVTPTVPASAVAGSKAVMPDNKNINVRNERAVFIELSMTDFFARTDLALFRANSFVATTSADKIDVLIQIKPSESFTNRTE